MEHNTTMTEAQRLAKRRRIQKAKRKRAIINTIMIMMIISASLLAIYFASMYKKEIENSNTARLEADAALKEADAAKQQADEANQAYDKLTKDLKNNGYITIDEAKNMADQAAEDMSEDYRERIMGYMEGGDGTLTMLENLFEDKIVVPDTGKYLFFDIDESLAKSVIDLSKLDYPDVDEDTGVSKGDIRYDGDVTLHLGVDVSKFQGEIDWQKVKNDDIEYAYIRLGYRGYESGKIVTDEKYEDNIQGCNDVGLDCGVYFFTEAKTKAEGREEADFVLENLGEYHIELPIVIDVEQSSNVNKSRTKNLSKEDRTEAVIGFCERIKEAGYTPMIYGNLKSLMIMTDITKLEDYDKWFAYYHYPLRFPYKAKIWQYTSAGSVDGIKGEADLNVMFY